MSRHVEDRWHRRPAPGADRRRTARYGHGPRYRADFIDPAGHRTTKRFRDRRDAERWLARIESAHLLKGRA